MTDPFGEKFPPRSMAQEQGYNSLPVGLPQRAIPFNSFSFARAGLKPVKKIVFRPPQQGRPTRTVVTRPANKETVSHSFMCETDWTARGSKSVLVASNISRSSFAKIKRFMSELGVDYQEFEEKFGGIEIDSEVASKRTRLVRDDYGEPEKEGTSGSTEELVGGIDATQLMGIPQQEKEVKQEGTEATPLGYQGEADVPIVWGDDKPATQEAGTSCEWTIAANVMPQHSVCQICPTAPSASSSHRNNSQAGTTEREPKNEYIGCPVCAFFICGKGNLKSALFFHMREEHGWNYKDWFDLMKNEMLRNKANIPLPNICGGCHNRFQQQTLLEHFKVCPEFRLEANVFEASQKERPSFNVPAPAPHAPANVSINMGMKKAPDVCQQVAINDGSLPRNKLTTGQWLNWQANKLLNLEHSGEEFDNICAGCGAFFVPSLLVRHFEVCVEFKCKARMGFAHFKV